MMSKGKKRFAITMTVLLFTLLMILLSGTLFKKQIIELNKKHSQNPTEADTLAIDWEKLYPYDSVINSEMDLPATGLKTRLEMWGGKIVNTAYKFRDLGMLLAKHIYKYTEISQLGYIIRSRLSDPAVGSTCIRLRNGYWTGTDRPKDFASAKKDIAPYATLSEYLKKEGRAFLYCFAPSKLCKVDNQIPDGVTLYGNENIDTYIEALDFYGVDTVDFREMIHRDGLDHYSLFYITDHHWNINAGLWAAAVITEEISDRYGIPAKDPNSFGTYERVTYKDALFGSAGQTVTHFVEQSEDFDILYPEFATNFRLEIPDKEVDVTGPFEELFINHDGLQQNMDAGGGTPMDKYYMGTALILK